MIDFGGGRDPKRGALNFDSAVTSLKTQLKITLERAVQPKLDAATISGFLNDIEDYVAQKRASLPSA